MSGGWLNTSVIGAREENKIKKRLISFSSCSKQVSYNAGLRHFTVHSYPLKKASCGLSCFIKSRRSRKDFRFVASSIEEALQWVGGFADQHCFVNCLPHPLLSSKKQASSELLHTDTPPELLFRCKTPPKMLVILNPRSGRGRSSKVFHGIVEPIFKVWCTLSWIPFPAYDCCYFHHCGCVHILWFQIWQ